MKQMGTIGTTLLKSSRTRRKVPLRKVMRHVPEAVRTAPDDKLSLFVTIPGASGPVLKSLVPGCGRSLVRQAKSGRSCKLKGACHVNCPFDM